MPEMQRNITPAPHAPPATSLRSRLRVLQGAILALFLVVVARLVDIQIIKSEDLKKLAERQYEEKLALPAARGNLLDRNGMILASNRTDVSFAADPKMTGDDSRVIAAQFGELFGKPVRFYQEKLRSNSRFVWLERQVDRKYLRRVNVGNLHGLISLEEPRRVYFVDNLAGQLLGFAGRDDIGIAGEELEYDSTLGGRDGYVILQRDGLGNARRSVDYPRVDPVNGHHVMLTIDIRLQAIVEKELRRGIESNSADGGIAIMLQPRTGEILAMAQYPPIDPNDFARCDQQDQKLRAVTDAFEPGSIFKIVTASAALEHHLVTPDKRYFAENGVYRVPLKGGRYREIRDTHKEGWITFREAMEYSSNIVMAKVSDAIGSERMYKTARDFGFGIPTDIDFPGEADGVLKKPSEWSGTTLNSIAFGYEVGATPIQIAAAYAAIANGGILMKPYLFRREIGPNNEILREGKPQQIRRVVSPATARIVKNLLEDVVDHGTGKAAAVSSLRIAGKTGTSKKYTAGHYEDKKYTASFVGFFPADDPQVLCLVMMDNPSGDSYYGGLTSAPVFHSIVEQIINTSSIVVQGSGGMDSAGASIRPSETSGPAAATPIPVSAKLSAGIVPDVKGLSVRRAVGVLSRARFDPVVSGTGMVVSQRPPGGKPARAGTKIVLTCQPGRSAPVGAN